MTKNEKKTWPMLLDMTKDECKQTLRALELSTYSKVISVLRAQGELTKEKRKIISDLQSVFSISVERHRAEIRRAVNDELLNTIAEMLAGPNTDIEWAIEGRRLVPLMPRAPPQVAYTALATKMAQLYCGINTQLPNPCNTAVYGKLDDLGADVEMTDSEEETEGLRYITQSMVPQQYNADQGSYTTLPLSQTKVTKEKISKEKKDSVEETSQDASPSSPPLLSSSMSSESNTSTNGLAKQTTSNSAPEKRKRKRSLSDHPNQASPPPPPIPTSLQSLSSATTSVSSLQGIQTTANAIRQLPNIASTLSGSSMKITVTGGITKSSSSGPISSSSQQKVILVSTSAASGSVGSMYQRSISVPILKPTSLTTVGTAPPTLGIPVSSQSGTLKTTVPSTTTATTTTSVASSVVNKVRPRFTSSFLSQGSSSLPGVPPRPSQRPRSNSLILQSEGEVSTSRSLSTSSIGHSTCDSGSVVNTNSLNIIGPNTLQLRAGPSVANKSSIQVKQDGGKLITHAIVSSASSGTSSSAGTSSISTPSSGTVTVPSVVGGRIIGRASLPSSSQGLYVVSTSSGTITVVTRTVASAAISNPRVVTMNTISNSRPSIVRGPATTTVMSMGMNQKSVSTMRQTGSIRPVMSASKSNVIVVHKGTIGTGARPVGFQGLRDLSTKIIKPPSQGISSNSNSGSSGILSGTLVVKPSPATTKSVTNSNTKDNSTSSVISTGSVSSSNVTTTYSSGSGNNLIVVDLNCESSSNQNPNNGLTNVLHTSGTSSSGVKNNHSLFSSGNKNFAEATPSLQSIQVRRESSSSHDISTVSASSSLPSTFRVFKSSLLPSDREEMEVETGNDANSEEVEDRLPVSNLVSSTSDVRNTLDAPDEGYTREDSKANQHHHHHHSVSSLSIEEHDEEEDEEEEEMEEEDNEWLKLGLEDEDDPELEEDDEERASDVSSGTEKSATAGDDSVENEAEGGAEGTEQSSRNDKLEKESKPGTSGEASVSSSTGTGNEKDGEIQMLVEKAVEVLKGGDSDQARSLLYKAGFELIDSSSEPDQGSGTVELQDGYSISNIAGVSSSSAMLCSGTPLSASTPLRDESSLGSMSELDPTTGYFYSPSGGENSSEPTSNRADSPISKDEDSLAVPEFEDEN